MINVDRNDPNVRLVTDRPDHSHPVIKTAAQLDRLDCIEVLGVISEIIATQERNGLLDITVDIKGDDYTSVKRLDAPVLTYPRRLLGAHLR